MLAHQLEVARLTTDLREAESLVQPDRALVPGRDEQTEGRRGPVARCVVELGAEERLAEPAAGQVGPEPDPDLDDVAVPVEPQERVKQKIEEAARTREVSPGPPPPPPPAPTAERVAVERTAAGSTSREELGTQTVEGVAATGSRTTTTIPAGAIGNLQPIKVVAEQWFSSDLDVMVMTKHSDPRVGETIYRLQSIVRAEPDRSLFTLPPDYTLKESGIRPQMKEQ